MQTSIIIVRGLHFFEFFRLRHSDMHKQAQLSSSCSLKANNINQANLLRVSLLAYESTFTMLFIGPAHNSLLGSLRELAFDIRAVSRCSERLLNAQTNL